MKELPSGGDRSIKAEEVSQSARIASPHRLLRHEVSADRLTLSDAIEARVRRRQPQVEQVERIAALLQSANPWSKCAARKRRLEREILALPRELAQPCQHHSARVDRRLLGMKCRPTARDHVGIHEFFHMKSAAEHLRLTPPPPPPLL